MAPVRQLLAGVIYGIPSFRAESPDDLERRPGHRGRLDADSRYKELFESVLFFELFGLFRELDLEEYPLLIDRPSGDPGSPQGPFFRKPDRDSGYPAQRYVHIPA